ncbi:MAG: hypothetical protein ACI865_002367 [Flavobacteriaceae bacterium]|jgi:hypothetical protein
MKELCAQIDTSFAELIKFLVVEELPDSRSVGGKIEHFVKHNWETFCETWNVIPQPLPGARSLYDISFLKDNVLHGVDIKTKNIGESKYSDGGIGAVKNLLNFYDKTSGFFFITEFGYSSDERNHNFVYVKTAPFHCLPLDNYRIENLGTGQIRFNKTINEVYDDIDWDRSVQDFLGHFCDLAAAHYTKVAAVSLNRRASIEKFKASNFTEFKLK